jgi:GAF domain-containing protein
MRLPQGGSSAPESGQGWTPGDYAMRGAFCSIEEIEGRLEAARERAGADAVLLLSADPSAVLGTLCMALPPGEEVAAELGELLSRGELRTGPWVRRMLGRRRAALQELIRTSVPARGRQRDRFPATASNLIRVLAEIARRREMPRLAERLEASGADWIPARIPLVARRARVSTAVLFLGPRRKIRREEDGTRVVALDDDVLALTERVNGTVQANVRRDDLIMRQFDSRLASPLPDGRIEFESMATDLLALAVDASDSHAGACYLLDPTSGEMELAATYLPQHLGMEWEFEEPPAKEGSIATACAEVGQAIQLPPGHQSKPGLSPTCRRLDGEGFAALELATPMPGPLGSPRPPGMGALVIAKLSPGVEAFGAYEMALLRNAALRLALVNASAKAERAAQSFTALSRSAARLRRNSLATNMMKRAERQISEEAEELHKVLPDDLEMVLPVIEKVLSELAEITQSETATFRAALPDGDVGRSHGVTLARVAVYPADLADDPEFALQPDNGSGVNWEVAKEGRLRYRPDVRDEPSEDDAEEEEPAAAEGEAEDEAEEVEYVRHHPDAASELCVPVFVEDRVVGVVNLESPVVRAYDAQIDIAQALAEHVGAAIANARLVLSGVLQVEASDVLRKGHDLTHAHEPLLKIASAAAAPVDGEIRAAASQIKRETHELRSFSVDPRERLVGDRGGTFLELVNVARGLVELEFDELDDGGIEDWRPHNADNALLIVRALTDILDNARRHRSKDVPRIDLRLRRDRWGGQEQDILVVETVPRRGLRRSQAVNAYRCPLSNIEITYGEDEEAIRLTDEPRLGAYLAGTHARRAGGDVHLAFLRDKRARVIFSVPSPPGERS